jgi:di/tricarboxylate transporter
MVTIYILGLLVAAVVLFSMERLSVDMITLLLLLALLVPGILTPSEAFAGFSNDIIIVLASIFVLSAALQEAGVLDWIGEEMRHRAKVGSSRFLITLMGIVGATSSLMNNTTVTALFTPVVSELARKAGVSPSKLLMPVAFASILGGTCTLIGTSTNVAVSGFLQHAGLEPVGMFETTLLGVLILGVGILYMAVVGVHMLPVRHARDVREGYTLRQYLSEVVVRADSPLDGQPLGESDLSILDFSVLKLVRNRRPAARKQAPWTCRAPHLPCGRRMRILRPVAAVGLLPRRCRGNRASQGGEHRKSLSIH